ncbi:transglycosylase SLT domain-containing protein [Uliginosibacterium gangwonense]|uniref:transglycosylase SLT domain-containing protein n=1 Tax=Uliginosibacterium gangwonense TaxID=392736 RepID=UPI00035C5AEC|nr:transglycosylase SLT domain-containing protein [Uliginosibacterium gangwonense]
MNLPRRLLCGLGGIVLTLASSLCLAQATGASAKIQGLSGYSSGSINLAMVDSQRLTLPAGDSLTLTTEMAPVSVGSNPSAGEGASDISAVDLTNSSGDIWGRIRKGFGMPDLASPVVDDRIAYYTARPQALRTMLERGRKYMYHIVGELEKRGMPTELALLPLVESAYNPQAMSSAKAAGLWQFIPSTGKDFKLTQNWWVDQRRDVIASTDAALQYLQAIYEMHGDWQLALASYNWGEGAVARAIANNRNAGRPTDFNSLNMPAETRQYVPKLQALKQIIAHPELYAVQLPNIPNRPYFTSVPRRNGMDVAVAAKLAEMSQADFLALNPAYNRPVIPGNHEANLVLPVENAVKFEQNLAQYKEPLLNWKTYSLPRIERIDQLAQRLHLDVDALRSANGLAPRARLAAGYTLLIPQDADTNLDAVEIAEQSTPRHSRKARGRSERVASRHVDTRSKRTASAKPRAKVAAGHSSSRRKG